MKFVILLKMQELLERRSIIFALSLIISVTEGKIISPERISRQVASGLKHETFMDLVQKTGYPVEEHEVITEDGYILKMHRMPGSPSSPPAPGKPVVIFLHGLFASSEVWVIRGPGKDLAFLLVDEGYDVWFENARGNLYCRSHTRLSPEGKEFWKFSWHEVGVYDVPAIIDYILDLTGLTKVSLIGYSMGTNVAHVLLSDRPEYNEKVNIVVSLAPVFIFTHGLPGFLSVWIKYGESLEKGFKSSGTYELFPYNQGTSQFVSSLCAKRELKELCFTVFYLGLGYSDAEEYYKRFLPTVAGHYPAGTSVDTTAHFRQIITSGKFRHFDYGPMENLDSYGSKTPPDYALNKVTAPGVLYYALSDPFCKPSDIRALEKALPNVIKSKVMDNPDFNHIDFVFSEDSKELLYDDVIKDLQEFNL